MNVEQLQKQSKQSDDAASDQVIFTDPRSMISPDGPLRLIIDNDNVNDQTTIDISQENFQQGKFLEMFDEIDFEELDESGTDIDGEIIWSKDELIENINYRFYLSKSELFRSVTLTEASDDEIAERADKYEIDPGETYITIDGEKYFIDLHISLNFGVEDQNALFVHAGMMILGGTALAGTVAEIITKFGANAFAEAIQHLTTGPFQTFFDVFFGAFKAGFRYMSKFIGQVAKGAAVDVAADAAAAAAGNAWKKAIKKLTTKTLKYNVFGVIILVCVLVLIKYILHETYQNIYVYNLTEYDIELDIPYTYSQELNLTTNLIKKPESESLGGVNLGTYYNALAFQFDSDSTVQGIGFTLRLRLKDSDKQIVKTFSALFYIPFSGDNSLYASTQEFENYQNYFENYSDKQKVTQYSANDGEHEIIVTYDYLRGQHPDPETQEDLYLYNSLVVIRDFV